MSTAERLQRKLAAQQRGMGHEVRTVVPEGWEPYHLMQLIKWEDGEIPERKLSEGVFLVEKPLRMPL